ncbi:lambda-crystallin homolog isoform X2 [Haliotis rufescens]|uniref:lambda-crystallin homolog isoform X2 n=1 Tax=Haliotis rufescens TaxID=6454 RepID=UPI00201FA939|nr:lambda-crystallin homolog isoform X2 [Haliotis rufescens]
MATQQSEQTTELKEDKIAIIGSGQIGGSWAVLFASAGYQVALYDVIPDRVTRTLESLLEQLHSLSRGGLLRGTLGVEEQWGRIRGVQDLGECVTGAIWVQECVPEDKELKRQVLTQVDQHCSLDTTVASSSSSILPSELSRNLKHKENFLVVHPTNPPFYSRAVELVPAPWTAPETMTRAQDLMKAVGQSPITLKTEIPGFVLNRMQFAIMAESYRLVKGGFLSPDGVNKALSAGLGRRYAFNGPFQTAHLNAEGFGSYCERYGDMIFRVQQSFGAPEQMGGALAEHIEGEMVKEVPLDSLEKARRRREAKMAALGKLKADLDSVKL